jgi:hypothetical protein
MAWRAAALIAAIVLAPASAPAEAGESGKALDNLARSAPLCRGVEGYSADFEGRRTFLWQPDRLASARSAMAEGQLAAARRMLLAEAERALDAGPYSVVDKTRPPDSGDLHDYTSLGPYWWPDPARPDGRPYVRRDGTFNPERDGEAYDLTGLENMSRDVQALALAYYFTGESRYATQAAVLVRTWFLDPATRMNPNLAHAQSIPGRVAGRAEGIIDAHRLVRVVESVGLLASSGVLDSDEQARLRAWFGDLVHWMQVSPIGKAERAKDNNHGVYYDLLLSHFALFAGDADTARRTIEAARRKRLAAQIDRRGALPKELARTRSLHYTTWTIAAAMDLADLGRCVDVDLWNYPDARKPLLRTAVDFVAPYAGRERSWPWPELDKDETIGLYEILIRATWAWDDPDYLRLAEHYAPRHAGRTVNLLQPAFPDP